jgi:hypothetical protein
LSLRTVTAPLVLATAAVWAACRSAIAAVTVASSGAAVENALLPVIRVTMAVTDEISAGTGPVVFIVAMERLIALVTVMLASSSFGKWCSFGVIWTSSRATSTGSIVILPFSSVIFPFSPFNELLSVVIPPFSPEEVTFSAVKVAFSVD